MRTNEERARLIHERTWKIKEENRRKKQSVVDICCIAASLLIIFCMADWMPGIIAGFSEENSSYVSGAASLIGGHAALGYILMGILAFLLGVCVTILLYRIRRYNEREKRED